MVTHFITRRNLSPIVSPDIIVWEPSPGQHSTSQNITKKKISESCIGNSSPNNQQYFEGEPLKYHISGLRVALINNANGAMFLSWFHLPFHVFICLTYIYI